MNLGSKTLEALAKALAKMPGIGIKTAQRLALYLLRSNEEEVERLGNLVLSLKSKVRFCRECGAITEEEVCAICTDQHRNRHMLCVVEEPQDIFVLEGTGHFKGLYHVLHGVLSPLDGVGPEELGLSKLEERIEREGVKEVLVATNPSVEGDTTALYISRMLRDKGCAVTRLARGLPMGGTLEYVDQVTLARAIEKREKL